MNEELQQKALGNINTTSGNKPTYNDNIGEGVVLKKKKYRSNGDFMRKQDRAESIQSFIEENYIY
tara:strand:+ start:2181 stop:2375 length:195 start_codon:yes stop_codon:yes gene_type:complete